LQERVNGLVDEVAQLKVQMSSMSQNHSRDGVTSPAATAELLQQAFINLTRHIYQSEGDARGSRQQRGWTTKLL